MSVLFREVPNTNFIVFQISLIRVGLEPTRGEHANYHTTDDSLEYLKGLIRHLYISN